MKRVILVGATDGIGRALAEVYAQSGFWVALVGRSPDKLKALGDELRSKHPAATVREIVCDLRDTGRLRAAFEEAVAAIGHCDLFLYVAGVMHSGDDVTSVPEDDAETFQVNTVAAAIMLGLAGNYFQKARRGQIAAISSIAGDRGRKGNPAYTASKAALTAYLEGLRGRMHPFGVTVSTVKPGFVDTKMVRGRKAMFWVAPPDVAARTIADRLDRGHEVFYVYRRWAIVGLAMRLVPRFLFKRIGPP